MPVSYRKVFLFVRLAVLRREKIIGAILLCVPSEGAFAVFLFFCGLHSFGCSDTIVC